MSVPVLEGVIGRRVLLNFRADADLVQALLPAPLQVEAQRGSAVVGICLIQLRQVRPKALPPIIGLSSARLCPFHAA